VEGAKEKIAGKKRRHAASTVTFIIIISDVKHAYMNISSLSPHSNKNGPALKDGCK
jgi:hypothetical protein